MILFKTMSPQHPNCNQECTLQFRKWSSMSLEPFVISSRCGLGLQHGRDMSLGWMQLIFSAMLQTREEKKAMQMLADMNLISESNFHKHNVKMLSVLILKIYMSTERYFLRIPRTCCSPPVSLWCSCSPRNFNLSSLPPPSVHTLPVSQISSSSSSPRVAWVYLHGKTLTDHPNSLCVLKILCETHLKPHSQGVPH